MAFICPIKSYLIILFISMWMWLVWSTKKRLICSGQVAEPTSGGCPSHREPAHNAAKDDYANRRPFPETFPGRGEREGGGAKERVCAGGGAALRTSGRLCLAWWDGWKRLSEKFVNLQMGYSRSQDMSRERESYWHYDYSWQPPVTIQLRISGVKRKM